MANKISFNFDTKQFENITISQVKFWESAYPDCDVVDILTKKMPVWLYANRDGKGRKKKWERFIVNWLSRQQEKYDQFKRK